MILHGGCAGRGCSLGPGLMVPGNVGFGRSPQQGQSWCLFSYLLESSGVGAGHEGEILDWEQKGEREEELVGRVRPEERNTQGLHPLRNHVQAQEEDFPFPWAGAQGPARTEVWLCGPCCGLPVPFLTSWSRLPFLDRGEKSPTHHPRPGLSPGGPSCLPELLPTPGVGRPLFALESSPGGHSCAPRGCWGVERTSTQVF